jgi:hypothetical protein
MLPLLPLIGMVAFSIGFGGVIAYFSALYLGIVADDDFDD